MEDDILDYIFFFPRHDGHAGCIQDVWVELWGKKKKKKQLYVVICHDLER